MKSINIFYEFVLSICRCEVHFEVTGDISHKWVVSVCSNSVIKEVDSLQLCCHSRNCDYESSFSITDTGQKWKFILKHWCKRTESYFWLDSWAFGTISPWGRLLWSRQRHLRCESAQRPMNYTESGYRALLFKQKHVWIGTLRWIYVW